MKDSESKLTIKKDNLSIVFEDLTTEDDLFYLIEGGEEPRYLIQIKVYRNKEKKAQYELEYDWSIGTTKFNQFVLKFLLQPEYRKKFVTEGKWEEIIEFTTSTGYRINPICKKGIGRINSMKNKNLRFKHFANLKTGGLDGFSRLKLEKLREIIPKKIFEQIMQEELDEKMTISCLRWIARGLIPYRAVRKVKTDEEIRNNIR